MKRRREPFARVTQRRLLQEMELRQSLQSVRTYITNKNCINLTFKLPGLTVRYKSSPIDLFASVIYLCRCVSINFEINRMLKGRFQF